MGTSMAAKSGSRKKSGSARSRDAGDKDRLIAELKKTKLALQKREADLLLSQKIAHIGSWHWNRHTNKNEWSDEFYRILGLEPQSIKPNLNSFLSLVHPDDRAMVVKDSSEAAADHRPSSMDYRIVRPDGSTRYVHVEAPHVTLVSWIRI
jgi:PAS domain-containing protein